MLSPRAEQKIRDQDKGHEYAEKVLIGHGARPMRAGQDPRAWLREALPAARVRNVRQDGKHRYLFAIGNRTQRRHVRISNGRQAVPEELARPASPVLTGRNMAARA